MPAPLPSQPTSCSTDYRVTKSTSGNDSRPRRGKPTDCPTDSGQRRHAVWAADRRDGVARPPPRPLRSPSSNRRPRSCDRDVMKTRPARGGAGSGVNIARCEGFGGRFVVYGSGCHALMRNSHVIPLEAMVTVFLTLKNIIHFSKVAIINPPLVGVSGYLTLASKGVGNTRYQRFN